MATSTPNGDTTAVPAPASTTADALVTDPSAIKRKREDEHDTSSHSHSSINSHSRLRQVQLDILDVLERHDSEPSLLNHNIEHSNTDEPSPKKARISDPTATSSSSALSIAAKLRDARYASLRQIQVDAARVAESLAASLRAKAKDREGYNAGRPTVDELKQMHKAQSLAGLVKDIVDQESQYIEPALAMDSKLKKESGAPINGQTPASTASDSSSRLGNVLTLFGNAPTPKQLFSSMQHSATPTDRLVKSELPVDEMSLPNGIAATKIMGAPPAVAEEKSGPTFEQAFPPPYNLPALPPPKAYKRPATRDNTVTWEFKDPIQRNKRGGYTVQPLSTGAWLSYGGEGEDVASPHERRKLRDRALSSTDGSAQKPVQELSEEATQREAEALFRRAYSSFAPTRDDANALVPEEIKNDIWWHKVGEERFNKTLAIDPALLDEQPGAAPALTASLEIDDDEFTKAMEDLDELEKANPEKVLEPTKSKTDVEQVLREVNDLLQTLASYQRIRNATLVPATSSRPLSSPGPTSSRPGKPDQPSDEEVFTYNSLRRELSYLLLKLPPYAVAKLDGDQLADLGVKQVVSFEKKDVRGVMEEDLVTRQAKLAQQATAASIANLARPNSSSAGQHYNQTAQRTPAIGQAANTRYGQQYNGRPPAISQFQRQASTPSTYGTPPTAARASYGQTQQYTRPGAPQTGYGQTNSQQYYQQRPLQQTPGGYNNYNASTPLQQRPSYGSGPSQPQYQQRAQANAANYNTGASQQHAYNRNISPIKPGYPTPTPPLAAQQQRPMYQPQAQTQPQQPNSGRATPVSYPSQPNTPVNGYQPARPMQGLAPRPTSTTPQPPHASGPTQPPSHPSPQQQQAVQTNGTL